jgi:hypothetical protein
MLLELIPSDFHSWKKWVKDKEEEEGIKNIPEYPICKQVDYLVEGFSFDDAGECECIGEKMIGFLTSKSDFLYVKANVYKSPDGQFVCDSQDLEV